MNENTIRHTNFSDPLDSKDNLNVDDNDSKILCQHCLRTFENGLRCIGKCVADSNY